MPEPISPTSGAILGLLSLRSWSTYELAKQVQRSVGWFWPRAERKLYEEPKRLVAAGFAKGALTESNESVEANYEQVEGRNGNMLSVQQGNIARLSITINTAQIAQIIAATKGIVQFEADGHPVNYGPAQFLVSNLEELKMSLIGAAMKNARVAEGLNLFSALMGILPASVQALVDFIE